MAIDKDMILEAAGLKEAAPDIQAKNVGILEVPDGKNVEDLPASHFVALAKKKGLEAVSKALVNLARWNKKQNPKLAKWADDMQEKVSKEMEEK